MAKQQIDFSKLETQVVKLITRHEELAAENRFLRQKLTKLAQEKAVWVNKKQKMHDKLKTLITHIKDELSCQKH